MGIKGDAPQFLPLQPLFRARPRGRSVWLRCSLAADWLIQSFVPNSEAEKVGQQSYRGTPSLQESNPGKSSEGSILVYDFFASDRGQR